MIVCIAEKSSVAHDIAEILGAHTGKERYIEGGRYQITRAFGHLHTLKEPCEYTLNWESWNLGSLPMIPSRFDIKLIENSAYEKQFHIIEGLMQNAGEIINCGDTDQGGELAQRWVMQKVGARCPVKRLWISSLIGEMIREGFAKLKGQLGFQSLHEVGLSHAMGDWLLRMSATRLYTIEYSQNRQVPSIGRVQTPMLALIVNCQLETANFQSKQYWELKTNYRDIIFSALIRKSDEEVATEEGKSGGKKKMDNPDIDPIANRGEGEALVERIRDPLFIVTGIGKKDGEEYVPRLLGLISLQVECNKKFVYSVDETPRLIQSLYEKKMVTYPRVGTTSLSSDAYSKCPGILKGLRDYEVLTAPLADTSLPKSKRVFDNSEVTDRHATISTGVYAQNLADMERYVYDLIAHRFITVFYPDRKISATTMMGEVDKIELKVTGKQVPEPRWRVVFAEDVKDIPGEEEEEDEDVLPASVKGESGPHVLDLSEKQTRPPGPYAETTLFRAMETAGKLVDNDELRDTLKENGIGRPSTRAAIIGASFKRNYIRRERKNLIATSTGAELVQIIREELPKPAELTGIQGKKLRETEKKTYGARQFLEELKQMVSEIVMNVLSDNTNRHVTIQEVVTQAEEKIKKELKKRERKANAPKEKKTKAEPKVPTFSPFLALTPFAPASAPATGNADIFIGQPCPVCGRGTIIKGKTAYGYSE